MCEASQAHGCYSKEEWIGKHSVTRTCYCYNINGIEYIYTQCV